MEITKGTLPNGASCIEFDDQFDDPCKLSVSKARSPFLKFNFSHCAQFSQEDVKAILPYLQSFADHGTLEPKEGQAYGD